MMIAASLAPAQDAAPSTSPTQGEGHVGPIRHPGASSPSFTLALHSGTRNRNASEFRAGSDVWITIVEKNITNHTIDFSGSFSGGVDNAFLYDVKDEDGKPAEQVQMSRLESQMGNPYWSDILAGESEAREVLLSQKYKFDRPGKYFIQVSRPDIDFLDKDGNRVVVKSNIITITITG